MTGDHPHPGPTPRLTGTGHAPAPAPGRAPRRRAAGRARAAAACGLLLWCAAAPLPPAAQAQSVGVNATLSDPSVEVGQPVDYTIEVTGARPTSYPRPPLVDGLTVAGNSQSMQVRTDGFGLRESALFIYTLIPDRAGTYVIPPQDVHVGARELHTPPVTLVVTGGGGENDSAAPLLTSELIVPKKTAYVGEALPTELRVTLRPGVRLLEAETNPILNGEDFAQAKFTAPQMVQGSGSTPTQVILYKTAITAATAGTLTVGPAEVTPTVQVPTKRSRRRRGPLGAFDDDFFESIPGLLLSPARQIKVPSEPVQLEIRPLPAAGRPADFAGAIGRFEFGEAEVTPRSARVGDPVTVHLALRGRGNFDRIPAPALRDDRGLRTYPATSKFRPDDEVGLSGTKTFEQVVIAQEPRDGLPGYHFSFFDPGTNRYVSLQGPPLPLRITADPSAAARRPAPASVPAQALAAAPPPAPGNAPPGAAPPAPNPPSPADDDAFRVLADPGPAWSAESLRPFYRRAGFWWFQLVPAAGLALLAAARVRAARARARARRRGPQRAQLLRTLRDPRADPESFYRAALGYAELRDDPGAGPPPSPLPEGWREKLRERHAELAYGGGTRPGATVPEAERREVLQTLTEPPAPAAVPAAAGPR